MLDGLIIAFVACVDSTLEYIRALLHDKRATWELPQELIDEIARGLLPDVVAYCESEEGKAEFAKWQQEQEKSKA